MKTCVVVCRGGVFLVVFKQDSADVRYETFAQWKDACRAMLAWV